MTTYSDTEMANIIASRVHQLGGTAYYVGGYVRDVLRGQPNKDLDIEVHGITPSQLEHILDSLGVRISIGESFGIYNLKGYSLDIAMPRKETNRGVGHKDFDICVDPFIGIEKAALRRDFTINAISKDILTGEIIDPYCGVKDIEAGIIRHVNDDTFMEDPLRALRAAQFAARFQYKIDTDTLRLCASLNLLALPKERIMGELEKALLKSDKPSIFFESLRVMHQLDIWFPEFQDLIGIEQNPAYHAEGDVWNHTLMVLDIASHYRNLTKNPLGFMLAALTHDFGKAVCTETINGVVHAYRHETIGLPIIETFIKRLTSEKDLLAYVLNMAELHMWPNVLARDNSAIKKTNKLFDRSVDPIGLIYLAMSDNMGRITNSFNTSNAEFFTRRLDLYNEYMSRPYVRGQDLVNAGVEPSVKFSDYLSYAHKLRLAGVSKDDALKQVLAMVRKDLRSE